MKLIKIGVMLLIIGGTLFLLNKESEKAVSSCIAAGNSQTYCEYHAG